MSAMPPQIAALPTQNGVPVTFTVAYSSDEWAVGRDTLLGLPAIMTTRGPGGSPVLTRACAERQRMSVLLGFCQVCAEPVAWPRWIADLRVEPGREMRYEDGMVPRLVDSWTCESCLRWSVTGCPRLEQLRRADRLTLFRVREAFVWPTPERPKHVTGLSWNAVGYVEVCPTDYDVVSVDEFLEAV